MKRDLGEDSWEEFSTRGPFHPRLILFVLHPCQSPLSIIWMGINVLSKVPPPRAGQPAFRPAFWTFLIPRLEPGGSTSARCLTASHRITLFHLRLPLPHTPIHVFPRLMQAVTGEMSEDLNVFCRFILHALIRNTYRGNGRLRIQIK